MAKTNYKEQILKFAITRRKKELEMLKLRSNFSGELLLDVVKTEWLELVQLENGAIDAYNAASK